VPVLTGEIVDADVGVGRSGLYSVDFVGGDVLLGSSHRMAFELRHGRVAATNPVVDRLLRTAGSELRPAETSELSSQRANESCPGDAGAALGSRPATAHRARQELEDGSDA